MDLSHAYAFLGGTLVGRFAGFVSGMVVSGVLLYVADPSIFTMNTMMQVRASLNNLILNK